MHMYDSDMIKSQFVWKILKIFCQIIQKIKHSAVLIEVIIVHVLPTKIIKQNYSKQIQAVLKLYVFGK